MAEEQWQHIAYHGIEHQSDGPALQLFDVYAGYTPAAGAGPSAQRYALEQVSFQVNEGEQLAIVGPNGAGKSTLLKLVAGLIRPDKGRIEMFGQAPDRHICIGYLPQQTSSKLSFPASVEDVVLMGRTRQIGLFKRPGKKDRQIVGRSLERVDAVHLAGKRIDELSGGQQQRVFIARALAQDSSLLLLDEPLSGLDAPSQEKLLAILDHLRPDGITVLAATHDLKLAGAQFDRILLLNRRVIAQGPAARVLTNENLAAAYGGQFHVNPGPDNPSDQNKNAGR